MKTKTVFSVGLFLLALTLSGCSSAKKESQPPTDADRQRIEKEYQQNIDKLHELTSGTKDTLDGKSAPKSKSKAQPSAER